MKTYEQFYINGEWVDPAEGKNMFEVLNPANEEVIGQIAMGSATDVDNAVNAASKAFET
ncbi:MAG: aldehyde dehydrogenase family protein, partial [SAR86 cluster bacterium]|nr:aldehyde dehydrogenase family protein [SAR86 cluster bacterium]